MSIEHAPSKKGGKRYRRKGAVAYLREAWDLEFSENTFAKWAVIGGGPPMEYVGRFPTYPEDGLDAWAKAKISPRVKSTSERKTLLAATGDVAA